MAKWAMTVNEEFVNLDKCESLFVNEIGSRFMVRIEIGDMYYNWKAFDEKEEAIRFIKRYLRDELVIEKQ